MFALNPSTWSGNLFYLSILHEKTQHRAFFVSHEQYLARTACTLFSISNATACGLWSISISHLNHSIIREEKWYHRKIGKNRSFLRLLDHEPYVLTYPYHYGSVELEIPHHRILEPPHPQISQLSLSIEPYKYKLMTIVEGENYRGIVMLLD